MCQVIRRAPKASASCSASMVLPVPGSPLTSRGRCRVMAALTASLRSSVATSRWVLSRFIGSSSTGRARRVWLMLRTTHGPDYSVGGARMWTQTRHSVTEWRVTATMVAKRCWAAVASVVVAGWIVLEARIEGFHEAVAQDADEGLERADVLLPGAAAELHARGDLVLTLVLQHLLAAADQRFPERTKEALVLVL